MHLSSLIKHTVGVLNNIWTHLKSDDVVGYGVEILNVADVVVVGVLVLVNESHERNAAVAGDVLLILALLDLENKNQQEQENVFDLLHEEVQVEIEKRKEDGVVQGEEHVVEENRGWSHVDDESRGESKARFKDDTPILRLSFILIHPKKATMNDSRVRERNCTKW
ncbi:hypothetical protein HAX54_000148 [Datura stramonium]|uniref:Uncharacterized protein n=1 Tax=Datura stramonium TaxID=4076 RepID=A0ABS8WRU4_DATST|nr:hypothetical protein [Datura stramonium]